jgi:hypothetical protein
MGDTRKTKGDLSWADLLSEERKVPAEEVPDGWKSAREIAAETNKSLSHTSWLLRVGVAEGRIEMQKFSIDVGTRTYPVHHYRIVE